MDGTSVTLEYKVNRISGNDLYEYQRLTWPNRCLCCDSPNPGTSYPWDKPVGTSATSSRANFIMPSWEVPYCSTCLAHLKYAKDHSSDIQNTLTLLGIWAFLALCIGLALLRMNPPLVLGILVLGAALIVFLMYRYHSKKPVLTPTCTCPNLAEPLTITKTPGPASSLSFFFPNEGYAEDFAAINGLQIAYGKGSLPPGTIRVNDPWRMGGRGPFLLQEKPDIHAILSSPDPTPPKAKEVWNQEVSCYPDPAGQTRGALAMAYMRHPSAEVREATINYVGTQSKKDLSVGNVLAQRLAVEADQRLRKAAAEAIWKRGEEELLVTLQYLAGNDECPGDDGNGAIVSRDQVWKALQALQDTDPKTGIDLIEAVNAAFYWGDENLAQLGADLTATWLRYRTFLSDEAKTIAREIGVKVHTAGGISAMKKMFRPVTYLLGSDAASELNHAWSGIGGWMP